MKWFSLINSSRSMDEAFRACNERGVCQIVMMEDENGVPWLGHMDKAGQFPPEARIRIPEGAVVVRDEMPDGWKIYTTTPLATPLNAWVAQVHEYEDRPRQATRGGRG